MSARREDETYEQYRARLLQEQKDERERNKMVVVTTSMNRAARREVERDIPADDLTIMAMFSEIVGDELPLSALELVYRKEDLKGKKTFIQHLRDTIDEYNTPKEKTNG